MTATVSTKTWMGHPAGLSTLFFTEMWERLSYYGMRALLVLYITATVDEGGLGFTVAQGATIYGWYTALVYFMALPGGFIADKWLGPYRSVLLGGIIISLGHFSLAIHPLPFFYTGLALIVIGTGLLKPNITSMVGALYERNDPRRDGGFSLYYMGINIGAVMAPLVCGTLGQKFGWHWGFGAAGVGMVAGVIQFKLGKHRIEPALNRALERIQEEREGAAARREQGGFSQFIGFAPKQWIHFLMGEAVLLGAFLFLLPGTGRLLAQYWWVVLVVIGISAGGFWLSRFHFNVAEQKRIGVIAILFVFSSLFFAGFEQAGSSLNLFADRLTRLEYFGFSIPSTWFQSLNPFYIIVFAPVFSWLWVALREREPSSPMKFVLGLWLLSFGFLILVPASQMADEGTKVSPNWLIMVYLMHTLGELCLSPVSLSMVTKLAPQQITGSLMGFWLLSYATGSKIGGYIASFFETMPLVQLFGSVFLFTFSSGLILLVMVPWLKRMMGGIK